MFCKQCGKELPDGSVFCPDCGAQQTADAPAAAAVSGGGAGKAIAGLSKRSWAKLGIVLTLLCFFLPFVTVSCAGSGKVLSESYNGFELMTTLGSGDDELLNERSDKDSSAKPNVFALGAFGCAVAALVVLYRGKKSKTAGILSACSAACMFLLSATFRPYYGLNDKEIKSYVTVNLRFGYVLVMLLFLTIMVICFIDKGIPETGFPFINIKSADPAATAAAAVQSVRTVASDAAGSAANAVSGTAEAAKDAASGAVDTVKDAASDAVDAAKDTVSGAVDTVKDAASDAVDAAKDTVSDAAGAAADAASELKND